MRKYNINNFLIAVVLLLILVFFWNCMQSALQKYDGNYSGFLRLRESRAQKVPFLSDELRSTLILREQSGYDGQWFYYIAFDPFLTQFKEEPERYRQVTDAPAYRFGRILFPIMTKLFSGNDPERFPKTMIYLILSFLLIGAFFFIKILGLFGKNPLFGFLYILIPGFSTSLNMGLPEPIASAFILSGLYFYLKERLPLSALSFSLAILTRETAILMVGVIVLFEFISKRRIATAFTIGLAVIPYIAWKLFLTWRLFGDYGWQTLIYTPNDFTIPFRGILDLYSTSSERSPGLLFYPVFIFLNLFFACLLLWRNRSISSLALLAYSMLYSSLNVTKIWGHIRDVERISNEGYLLLVIACVALPKESPALLRHGFLAVFALLLFYDITLASFDSYFRSGLFLPG